jgi:competence protein ComEC
VPGLSVATKASLFQAVDAHRHGTDTFAEQLAQPFDCASQELRDSAHPTPPVCGTRISKIISFVKINYSHMNIYNKIMIYAFIVLLLVLCIFCYIKIKPDISTDANNLPDSIKIVVMDVGQGDAILIKLKNKENILIDCGQDASTLEALGRNMDFYDKTINYLVLTHQHADHFGGCIDVLKRFDVKNIILNRYNLEGNEFYASFLESIELEEKAGAQVMMVSSTFQIDFSDLYLEFLYPYYDLSENSNNTADSSKINLNNLAIVAKLNYAGRSVLFMGDAETELEQHLIKLYGNKLKSDIVKIGHHGSATSSGADFLKIVAPEYGIISVGMQNDFGHPSLRTLNRLARFGIKIWRTDKQGDIIVRIGGKGEMVIISKGR